MIKKTQSMIWKNFTLREALYLCFCATFIVITRATLRLHLHITGHAMFFMMFFLILGRGCVPKKGAATFIGLIAGLLSLLLGVGGKQGPLVILKFLFPGFIVDCAGIIYPTLAISYPACAIVGGLASLGRVIIILFIDYLIGMELTIVMQHAVITSSMNTIFGILGSLMVPSVVRRLIAYGLVSSPP
ncbi:MAG: hypothetical protein JW786_15270 [Desulfobacterales bacterium]|nr:hypothetical protein [Desulfobacterales bacterium]